MKEFQVGNLKKTWCKNMIHKNYRLFVYTIDINEMKMFYSHFKIKENSNLCIEGLVREKRESLTTFCITIENFCVKYLLFETWFLKPIELN